ncbi:MAG: radical SAM protein [Desulfobacterales bacterium]|nr:radical SAM protein [Desulfobacterales bacterium]
MKVYLIKASSGSDYSKYKAETGGPPQNIFSTAAATPKGVGIEMTDETIGMKTNFHSKARVIAVFMSTPDALRAYEIADAFRAKGKIVVLGGLHTRFCKDEALDHADALLLGETEGIWETLLGDVENGRLKEIYQRDTPVELSRLNPYPTEIIGPKVYNYTWSVLVGRGCPNHCSFCLVHQFFDTCRFRPVEHIVEEIRQLKAYGVEWVELHADNLTVNRTYALALFKALAPLKMKFYGETTIGIAEDDELLQAAKEAGIKALLFGIETPSREALEAQGKKFVRPESVKAHLSTVKRYGIEVWGDFLVGFDAHDVTIFEDTLKFIKEIKADRTFEHLVIPFPGSDTYKTLDGQRRILTKDWSKYDGSHVVFEPYKMSVEELEEGVYWLWLKRQGAMAPFIYSLKNIMGY